MDHIGLWKRFKKYALTCDPLDFLIDVSRMRFTEQFLQQKDYDIHRAFADMEQLEAGALANPDERRMVGHYWLRDPTRAPTPEIRSEIEDCVAAVKKFAKSVHAGKVKPQRAPRFRNLLVVGIGGSALGPQFVGRALGSPKRDKLVTYYFDNTDPDGMDAVLEAIGTGLKETLVLVISKSGGTKETRNGMLEISNAFRKARMRFERHAVAITQSGSELDKLAEEDNWVARFPMWDWVGGRTSVMSAVGLLPAALQGVPIQGLLEGARLMDEATRVKEPLKNPAALLALMWLWATSGRGEKDMVILPYKDRLELFSRYLQQLVMESLGKCRDISGTTVQQGIAVYGNKGSTDQHAYVQQLREGVNNFFVTFIEVLKDRATKSMQVETAVTSGDYLDGFFQGTRQALADAERESITITVPDISPQTVGGLIALYERAVGLYASMVKINAYHQPGVEAGKKAAAAVLAIQRKVMEHLKHHPGKSFTVEELAAAVNEPEHVETVFRCLQHAHANRDHPVKRHVPNGSSVFEATYSM